MALQCLIIEDEPLAAEVLTDYISQIPFLATAGHCTDAFKALEILKKRIVDVLFLDLHLPGLKGFDLLKSLSYRPQIIITTAYQQYALQGYEWQVVDYLVKPIEFNRFLLAVNKLVLPPTPITDPDKSLITVTRPYIFIYADKKQVKLFIDEILWVESDRDYIKIISRSLQRSEPKTTVIRQTLQDFEKQLPDSFLRVHRSFVVNAELIDAYDSAHVEIEGKPVPVGRQFRDALLQKLQGKMK